VTGYVAGLAVAAWVYPAELAESSVLVLGDIKSGIAAINEMRSTVPMICSALKEALELCAAFKFDLTPGGFLVGKTKQLTNCHENQTRRTGA
jgi:hypothetical protein